MRARDHNIPRRLFLLTLLFFVLAMGMGCQPEREMPARSATPLSVDPRARTHLMQATEALHRRAFLTGLALTDSAAQYEPDHPDVHFIRGRLFFELGRMDEAGEAYRAVLALQPDYEGAWHNLGNVAFRQKQYQKALGHYRKEASLHDAPNPWHGMGGTFWTLGQADSARWAYERAVSADPGYAPAYASLADWYESEGAFDEALRYARHALERDPENLDNQYKVGALLFRAGQYEEAVAQLHPVIEARPWNYSALFNLGQALQRLGRREEAERYLAQANQVRTEQAEVERLHRTARDQPANFQHQIAYANALRRTGRLPEALNTYHVALSIRPENLALQNNVATLYLQQGDSTEALTRYRYILRRDSTFAETWLNLGLHYARTGRMEAAREAWKKAFTYGPDHPAVQAFRKQMQHR